MEIMEYSRLDTEPLDMNLGRTPRETLINSRKLRTPRWARRAWTTEPVAVLRFLAMATTGAIEIAPANTRLATDSVVRAEQTRINQRLPRTEQRGLDGTAISSLPG